MIESLAVENYRSFESYRIDRLATVNLLVGRNNCGKTSLLEAVDFVANKGGIGSLVRTAIRRNEIVAAFDEDAYSTRAYLPVMTHFFHGHVTGHDCSFVVDGGSSGMFRANILRSADSHNGHGHLIRGSNGELEVYDVRGDFAVAEVLLFPDDSIADREAVRFARRRSPIAAPAGSLPTEFVATSSLDDPTMNLLWNQIIRSRQEGQVIDALKLIDHGIDSVQFLTETGGGASRILVGSPGGLFRDDLRVPLGSFGEGMKRLLALAMALARTSDGVLLIDEIDTGLHYSVLPDMWKLVIETAIRNNVQVFATTHSLDCLRGLDAVCQDRPDFAGEVLVHKLDRNLDFAVTLDAADFQLAIEQELEVR